MPSYWRLTGTRVLCWRMNEVPARQQSGTCSNGCGLAQGACRVQSRFWRVVGASAVLLLATCTTDHPQRCHERYGEVDTDDSADLSTDQQGDNRRQRVKLQVASHDTRGNEVILNYPPEAKQCRHPDPMQVIYN